MKKIGIITMVDGNNYGNRLQNYALQETLKKMNCHVTTLKNINLLNTKKFFLLRLLKYHMIKKKEDKSLRNQKFKSFNENIIFSKKIINPYSNISKDYDYFIAGSDQIWKPTYGRMRDVDFLSFANDNQKISYAASFGINELSKKEEKYAKKMLNKFKNISVREEAGKKIVKKITGRNDIEVVLDPTMLLTSNEWKKVSKNISLPKKDYILLYYLGDTSDKRYKKIDDFAKKNKHEIINLLDKQSEYYHTGPSEFLYLIEHAKLVLTDSFHCCVFSIIFGKPFLVYKREDNKVDMYSRIDTLLKTFKLEDRVYNNNINSEHLSIDYKKTYEILKKEKNKSLDYLKKSIDIKK